MDWKGMSMLVTGGAGFIGSYLVEELVRRQVRVTVVDKEGAATTVIGRAAEDQPLYRHYQSLLDGGTKPNLAKLTIARQIASIVLALWRSGETYDPERLEATN